MYNKPNVKRFASQDTGKASPFQTLWAARRIIPTFEVNRCSLPGLTFRSLPAQAGPRWNGKLRLNSSERGYTVWKPSHVPQQHWFYFQDIKTWIDIDQMKKKSNIYHAMGEAVEEAEVFIMCMSKTYNHSENCERGKYIHSWYCGLIVREKMLPGETRQNHTQAKSSGVFLAKITNCVIQGLLTC